MKGVANRPPPPGRRWAFNLTCLFSSIFGLCLGASNSYTTFLVLTAFVGFGVGGNIPIDTTITLEFLPQNRRFLLAVLSVFQPVGVVLCSAIAFAFIPTMSCSPNFSEAEPLPSCNTPGLAPGEACCGRANNMGWRYLLFTLGGITLAVFCVRFFVFRFRESPKFLIYKGQDARAIAVVQHIAKTNGKECGLTIAAFEALTSESGSVDTDNVPESGGGGQRSTRVVFKRTVSGNLLNNGANTFKRLKPSKKKVHAESERYMMLFSSWSMARLTVLVWLTYIFDFWGFTVAGEHILLFSMFALRRRHAILKPPQASTSPASSPSKTAPPNNPSPSPMRPTSTPTRPASSACSWAPSCTASPRSAASGR